MKIYKYIFPQPDEWHRSFVTMPSSAIPLSVGVQGTDLVVWAKILDPDDFMVRDRKFYVVNTGVEFHPTDSTEFMGTHTIEGIVWHVFWSSKWGLKKGEDF